MGGEAIANSATGQSIQEVEDLIEACGVERAHLPETVSLIDSAHLKYERNRGSAQSIPRIGLND